MQSLEFAVLGPSNWPHHVPHLSTNPCLQAAGIPGTYRAIDLPPRSAFQRQKAQLLKLSGFNVTGAL